MTQQIGATLGGGLAPLAGTALIAAFSDHWTGVALYAMGIALLSSLLTIPLGAGDHRPLWRRRPADLATRSR
ncbi:hypothetical protein NKH77_49270 [Streptomyces sp. M19]